MNIEAPKINIYPERAAAGLDVGIKRLQDIENGTIKKIELQESEKSELLSFENSLGEELEKIVQVKNISSMIYTDYLLTEAGREDFQKTFSLDISSETPETIETFLYARRDVFLKPKPAERTAFSGRARTFADANLLDCLMSTMDASGEINIDAIRVSNQVCLSLNPEKTMERLMSLKNFKGKLKSEIDQVAQSNNSSGLEKAKLKILELYKRKTNQLLAGNFSNGIIMKKMADNIGLANLVPAERKLLELFNGLSCPEKNYSRYDKFIRGAETNYNESGYRTQIPQELIVFAENLHKEYLDTELNKNIRLREKGLDPEKIFAQNITCAEFSATEELLLHHYDSLSEYPASDYNPDETKPAPDNKWRFVARPEITEMSINGKCKTILAPEENQSVETMIAVLCGHETEGHFIQSINSEKIPLKLFRSNYLGGDRTALFFEGGAMMVQSIISQEAFGFPSLPKVPYVQAMLKKLEGGKYIDCVKVLYDTKRKILSEKYKRGTIDETTFKKELCAELKIAINRAKRLFDTGVDKNLVSASLTDSGDTVYLEQLLLMRKLQQHGMEKYAFIRGINLRILADLAEIGLIDLAQIKKPDLYSLEIWNKIKDNYKLPDPIPHANNIEKLH